VIRSLLLGFTLLFGSHVFADKAPPLRKAYALDEVASNVYVIHGPIHQPNSENQGFMNNPAFIVTDEGVVVVDPGASVQTGEMLLSHIAKVTDKAVIAVFNSHIHGDHWLGNQAIAARYPKAKIYAHPLMAKMVAEGEGDNWVELMMKLTDGATAGTRVVAPTDLVNDGDVIKVAGLNFHVIHKGPAHTETDIMILVKELGVIFLGDNAGYGRILRLDHGSYRGNIETLNLALASGACVFVPGHGKSGGPIAASAYRDFLSTLYETVKAGYDDGKSDFEIRPEVVSKLAAWKDWVDFDSVLGPHISNAFLEAEAADFE